MNIKKQVQDNHEISLTSDHPDPPERLQEVPISSNTCSGARGAGAEEPLLLDDEADPDEGGGGDGEERALEVGGEQVPASASAAAGLARRVGAHLRRAAAARGRRWRRI
jgi:hypothetical protein